LIQAIELAVRRAATQSAATKNIVVNAGNRMLKAKMKDVLGPLTYINLRFGNFGFSRKQDQERQSCM